MEAAEKSLERLLKQIQEGELNVQWNCWFFSGGRDWGDGDIYNIRKPDGSAYGRVVFNLDTGISFTSDIDDHYFDDICDEELMTKAEDVLITALKRDDALLVSCLSKDGEFLGLPREYGDVSREDVLMKTWTP